MSGDFTTTDGRGMLAVRALAMPSDTNPSGDIFGGWLLAQMDVAAGIVAYERAEGRVATVGIDAMTFHKPVHVGDLLSCYARVVATGTTSMSIHVESWVRRHRDGRDEKVTEGRFTLVAIDGYGNKRPVPHVTD
ncbi:acyl-CoA thioesterase [Marinivivus vitaminiproducens]|uniref:acyl-CoA thioesterase n=1 Tax=Marinivivus vitaminiproducens TaxID=3035935 RepID=UPI00279D9B57|nr:acyl-CoA thioesterase [Geminicoccaceae bacterium SCSIO 64248]